MGTKMATCGALLCGIPSADGTAKTALSQLQLSIDIFSKKSVDFLHADFDQESQIFGAFCARVLLENSCAAIVGRLDPFRLLYLSEFQTQATFEVHRPAKSGFKWTGDVISDDKSPPNLWSADHEISKINRALFSQYLDHVYWKPAIEKTLDHVSSIVNPALNNILSADSDRFITSTKGRCQQLYSTLSKGVHWEYFSSALVMDESTIKSAIRETCLIVGGIGLMSHFIPTAYASLSPDRAVEEYIAFVGAVS